MEKIKRTNLKHSYSDKIKVVELYKQGYGSTSVSKLLHISDTVVKTCLCRANGILGFEKPPKTTARAIEELRLKQELSDLLSFYQTF